MFPKSGKTLPNSSRMLSEAEYIAQISGALRLELGASARATKTVMAWTDASDRTARYWLSGEGGPSGRHLIALIGHSEAVLTTVLDRSGRSELLLAADLHAVEVALAKATGAFEALRRQQQFSKP